MVELESWRHFGILSLGVHTSPVLIDCIRLGWPSANTGIAVYVHGTSVVCKVASIFVEIRNNPPFRLWQVSAVNAPSAIPSEILNNPLVFFFGSSALNAPSKVPSEGKWPAYPPV